MKSENLAAKKRTFRRKGVTLLLACCGEKVHLPDAKKSTFRRKRVILLAAACLLVAKCVFLAFLSWMKSGNFRCGRLFPQ